MRPKGFRTLHYYRSSPSFCLDLCFSLFIAAVIIIFHILNNRLSLNNVIKKDLCQILIMGADFARCQISDDTTGV